MNTSQMHSKQNLKIEVKDDKEKENKVPVEGMERKAATHEAVTVSDNQQNGSSLSEQNRKVSVKRQTSNELQENEVHPGHVESIENVNYKSVQARRRFTGVARSIALLDITKHNYTSISTDDKNDDKDDLGSLETRKKTTTLLQIANQYRVQQSTEYKQRQKMEEDNYKKSLNTDEGNSFLAEYYQEQELIEEAHLKEEAEKKMEPAQLIIEMVFNMPWKKHNLSLGIDVPLKKISPRKKNSSDHSTSSDKKKEPKITYKSLNADGWSIFDSEESLLDKTKGIIDERGTKTELLIRVKRGLHLNKLIEERDVDTKSVYLKCYVYLKENMFQAPKKSSSAITFIARNGEALWDHVFILRGFTVHQLHHIYVIIALKAKCLVEPNDCVKTSPKNAQDIFVQTKDSIKRTISHNNVTIGKIILGGKEAKIFPSPALMYRDPLPEEYAAWHEACLHSGSTQFFHSKVKIQYDDLAHLLQPYDKEIKEKAKWHSIMHKPKKISSSSA